MILYDDHAGYHMSALEILQRNSAPLKQSLDLFLLQREEISSVWLLWVTGFTLSWKDGFVERRPKQESTRLRSIGARPQPFPRGSSLLIIGEVRGTVWKSTWSSTGGASR